MKKAVLLDVSAIMYRAYFANMNFRTKNEPTGAVYGFTNTLLSIIKEFSPDYIGAAFDVKRASLKRSEIYSEYKAQRDAVPEDLLLQIPRIEEVLDGFNINRFKIDGYEADDVMGTLSQKLSNEGIEVIVVTGDKDLAQILDKNVKIALLGKGEGGDKFKILETDEDVVEYLGVTSKMIPDFFGLIGDSSDGIPGVRKIGPKKAVPMLEKYGNLEGVYENIDKLTEIPGIGKSLIINMKEDKEIAFISRKLATIEKDIPLECKIDDLKYSIDNKKLLDLFKTLEFRVLVKKMGLESPALSVEEKAPEPTSLQMGLFSTPSVQENESVEPVAKQRNFTVVDDEEKFKQFSDKLAGEKRLAFFYSGTGFAVSSLKDDFYIPLGHTPLFHKNLDLDKVKEFFRNSDSIFITYNFKPLLNEGIKIKNMDMDLMIAYHLISSQTKEGVEIPLEQLSGIDIAPYSEKFGKEAPGNLSTEEYGKFLVERSKGIMETYGIAMEEIKGKNLLEVLKETEMPLIKVLSAMERKGIKIDPVYFAKYEKELEILLNNLQKKIFEIAGEEFNLNSPKQLAEVLFFKLNLDPVKKTKTGLSTDEEVLEKLKNDGVEIASYILEYRKYTFIKDFKADDYTPHICESNGWQYFWSVQHDINGLIDLVGGKNRFAEKLDSMFTYHPAADDELPIFSTGMIGQYAHGNEPSHHVIYLFNAIGHENRTQEYVAKVMNELYKNEPAGLCGNEDCGQMSAWYVFSAMGFYPVNPVSGKYEIGTPLFPEMQLHLANGKTFTVLAPKVNKENIYIQSIKIDGKPYDKTYLTHEQIMSGATVEFEMSNTPKAIGVIFEENNP